MLKYTIEIRGPSQEELFTVSVPTRVKDIIFITKYSIKVEAASSLGHTSSANHQLAM